MLSFVTLHPGAVDAYTRVGVYERFRRGGGQVAVVDLRRFGLGRHLRLDDRPFGGGDGMVMRPEPVAAALTAVRQQSPPHLPVIVIYPSPKGTCFDSRLAQCWGRSEVHYVFLCGRFDGLDQRIIALFVDREVSLGDFVLAGGELAALAMGEAMLRWHPGVLGNPKSAAQDSFGPGVGGGLEPPRFTRPRTYRGLGVPQPLLSGDHQAIAQWQQREGQRLTMWRRPELISGGDRTRAGGSQPTSPGPTPLAEEITGDKSRGCAQSTGCTRAFQDTERTH